MKYTRNKTELRATNAIPDVIGLTGGIGSGKSAAVTALRDAGYVVIDADEIARALFCANSDGEKHIAELFPDAVKNGRLDRAALRAIIASSVAERRKLEELTHPRIIDEMTSLLSAAARPVVLCAPLLFESALAALCDVTVCVYCPRGIRVNRIALRDGIPPSDAERIIDAQITDELRCTLADYIVPSDVPLNDFTEEITELFDAITRRSNR